MAAIARWASIFGLAIKRLWSHRGLMASIALGFATAISLVMSIPLYADAVGYGLLRQQLTQDPSRPPFAFLYRYVGAWSGAIDWQDYAPVDEYLSTGAPPTLGLPFKFMVRHVKTDNLRLFATEAGTYADTRQPLEWINV